MKNRKKPVIGLALGSGGANGLAHIGVIRTLEKHHIPIQCIAGSSIGALIGALYAVHGSSHVLEQIALRTSKKQRLRLMDPTLQGAILKGEKITHIIHEFLQGATFGDLKIPFAAIATDFNTAEPVTIQNGDLVLAVRASLSVPGIFQPVISEGQVLVDAGLSEPVPVEAVRSMGADIVIAVNLDELPPSVNLPILPKLTAIPWRSINILRHHLARESAMTADIVISPALAEKSIIGWNSFFNEEKVRGLISAGETAANREIDHIQQSREEYTRNNNFLSRYLPFIAK